MFIDAHLHLQDVQDTKLREEILARAAERGVGKFFCNAVRPEDWPAVAGMASADARVVPFFGIHPWGADKAAEGWQGRLEKYLAEYPASGIGEVGLDRRRLTMDLPEPVPAQEEQGLDRRRLSAHNSAEAKRAFDHQKEIFSVQLEIAKCLNRPFAVHCVQAWGELLAMLRSHGACRFMIHSFSGSKEVLRELLAMGAFISFSWKGIRDRSRDRLELLKAVPAGRMLLETDFPYTEPHQMGTGLTAEKYFSCLNETYAMAAEAREVSAEILQKTVWDNGETFLHGTHPR